MNAICLVVDGLQAGYVGAYGNGWIETPALNLLASQALVLDQALIDSPRLDRLYRAYWLGRHALAPGQDAAAATPLAARLATAGVQTTLVTDEPEVADHPLASGFREQLRLPPPRDRRGKRAARTSRSEDRLEATWLGQFFSALITNLAAAREPFLIWAHARGLTAPWDAPQSFREQYLEQQEFGSPLEVALRAVGDQVPSRRVAAGADPDEVLAVRRAYAGQISLLDQCVGVLLDALDELACAPRTLLVVTGARGFPLGEHGRLGFVDEALYEELVHVPWMMRFADRQGAAARSQTLVQPADLSVTLLDLWGHAGALPKTGVGGGHSLLALADDETLMLRDRACLALGETQRALRTPAWFLRRERNSAGGPTGDALRELFVKPDDRWEVNEVSSRCPDVAAAMDQALEQLEGWLVSGACVEATPLEDLLLRGPD